MNDDLLLRAHGVDEIRVPFPVPRLRKVDASGIILMGQTTARTFRARVGSFLKAITGHASRSGRKKGHHVEGRRFNLLGLSDLCDPRDLQIRLTECDEPLALEDQKLRAYQKEFGELPPLNSNGGVRPENGEPSARKQGRHHGQPRPRKRVTGPSRTS